MSMARYEFIDFPYYEPTYIKHHNGDGQIDGEVYRRFGKTVEKILQRERLEFAHSAGNFRCLFAGFGRIAPVESGQKPLK